MIFLQWTGCWALYCVGDLACKILNLYDKSDAWIYFWYPVYSNCMVLSSRLQDAAGYNPDSGADVSKWVWSKATDDREDNKCQ